MPSPEINNIAREMRAERILAVVVVFIVMFPTTVVRIPLKKTEIPHEKVRSEFAN